MQSDRRDFRMKDLVGPSLERVRCPAGSLSNLRYPGSGLTQ